MRQAPSLLTLRGTALDATIISEHSSAQNQSDKRYPEMHQAKQGSQSFFGMMARIGIDAVTGVVFTVLA